MKIGSRKAEIRFAAAIAFAFVALHLPSAQATGPVEDGALVCAACHGAHGQGGVDGIPRLAGQDADYMTHALSMFKAGTRASVLMQPVAQSLGDADMRELAEYFSIQ